MENWKVTQSMHNRLLMCAVLVASWLGVAPLYAQPAAGGAGGAGGAAGGAAPSVPNSKDNYEGDRVIFPARMQVSVDDGTGQTSTNPSTHCLEAGTELRGIGQTDVTKVNFVVTKCSPWLGFWPSKPPPPHCDVLCDADGTKALKTGSTVQIDLAAIQNKPPNRYGLAYGGLVVPFKFQLSGDHQFTGSATVGPYLGYRFAVMNYGWATTLAAFAGASNLSVTKNGSTQQLAGFSYGGGALIDVKGGFQGGVVLGFDSVGSNQGFQYNNKPWLALELGYSFSQ